MDFLLPIDEIIFNGGVIGTFIWILLIVISLSSFIVGLISVETCAGSSTGRLPLCFWLLPTFAVAIILLGYSGTVAGYINSFANIYSSNHNELSPSQIVQLSFGRARICFYFASLFFLSQLGFIAISWLIMVKRRKRLAVEAIPFFPMIKDVPWLLWISAVCFPPAFFVSILGVFLIEFIILLPFEASLLSIVGFDVGILLRAGFYLGLAGISILSLQMFKVLMNACFGGVK